MEATQKDKELQEAVKPLNAWLRKYGCPYTAVVVKQDEANVVEITQGIPVQMPD